MSPYNKKPWSEEDDLIIRRMYPHELTSDVAEKVGRTMNACNKRAVRLGVRKTEECMKITHAVTTPSGRPATSGAFKKGCVAWNKRMWSKEDDLIIVQLYPTSKISFLEELLNRRSSTIRQRASFLKVSKDKAFRSKQQSENGIGKHGGTRKSAKPAKAEKPARPAKPVQEEKTEEDYAKEFIERKRSARDRRIIASIEENIDALMNAGQLTLVNLSGEILEITMAVQSKKQELKFDFLTIHEGWGL